MDVHSVARQPGPRARQRPCAWFASMKRGKRFKFPLGKEREGRKECEPHRRNGKGEGDEPPKVEGFQTERFCWQTATQWLPGCSAPLLLVLLHYASHSRLKKTTAGVNTWTSLTWSWVATIKYVLFLSKLNLLNNTLCLQKWEGLGPLRKLHDSAAAKISLRGARGAAFFCVTYCDSTLKSWLWTLIQRRQQAPYWVTKRKMYPKSLCFLMASGPNCGGSCPTQAVAVAGPRPATLMNLAES